MSKNERETPPTGNIKRSSRRIYLANKPNRTLITAEHLLLLRASRVYFEVHLLLVDVNANENKKQLLEFAFRLLFDSYFIFIFGPAINDVHMPTTLGFSCVWRSAMP